MALSLPLSLSLSMDQDNDQDNDQDMDQDQDEDLDLSHELFAAPRVPAPGGFPAGRNRKWRKRLTATYGE